MKKWWVFLTEIFLSDKIVQKNRDVTCFPGKFSVFCVLTLPLGVSHLFQMGLKFWKTQCHFGQKGLRANAIDFFFFFFLMLVASEGLYYSLHIYMLYNDLTSYIIYTHTLYFILKPDNAPHQPIKTNFFPSQLGWTTFSIS